MRNISFALTTEQVRNRTKTVTRRLGWKTLKPGTLLQPVVKGMGLKKGETVEKIGGPIRIVDVRREPLARISYSDTVREGFGPGTLGVTLSPESEQEWVQQFIAMFCDHNGCRPVEVVTRIEFEYTEES